ncbi:MAG: hypothetical protein JEY79_15070 [Pseudodesulfovibrio sp.]|nr:hypothetical protein [Pseudodesulfovibrio sp.]
MNRFVTFFKSQGFAILLFHAGVLLFSWPILSLATESGETYIFKHLLIGWAIIVALLVVVGQCILRGDKSDKGD